MTAINSINGIKGIKGIIAVAVWAVWCLERELAHFLDDGIAVGTEEGVE